MGMRAEVRLLSGKRGCRGQNQAEYVFHRYLPVGVRSRARRLNVFHFSPRYEGRYGELAAEANAEYLGQQARYGELGRGHAPVS